MRPEDCSAPWTKWPDLIICANGLNGPLIVAGENPTYCGCTRQAFFLYPYYITSVSFFPCVICLASDDDW
jgi:hypothetical protein